MRATRGYRYARGVTIRGTRVGSYIIQRGRIPRQAVFRDRCYLFYRAGGDADRRCTLYSRAVIQSARIYTAIISRERREMTPDTRREAKVLQRRSKAQRSRCVGRIVGGGGEEAEGAFVPRSLPWASRRHVRGTPPLTSGDERYREDV